MAAAATVHASLLRSVPEAPTSPEVTPREAPPTASVGSNRAAAAATAAHPRPTVAHVRSRSVAVSRGMYGGRLA